MTAKKNETHIFSLFTTYDVKKVRFNFYIYLQNTLIRKVTILSISLKNYLNLKSVNYHRLFI